MHEEPGRCADKLYCKVLCWQLRCGLGEDKVLGEPCPHSPSPQELIKHLKGGRPYGSHCEGPVCRGRQGSWSHGSHSQGEMEVNAGSQLTSSFFYSSGPCGAAHIQGGASLFI